MTSIGWASRRRAELFGEIGGERVSLSCAWLICRKQKRRKEKKKVVHSERERKIGMFTSLEMRSAAYEETGFRENWVRGEIETAKMP